MSIMHSRSPLRIGRSTRAAAMVVLGRAMQVVGLAAAVVWLVLAVVWSDHGEGAGYATPAAVLAAAASLLIGWALRRLLAGD